MSQRILRNNYFTFLPDVTLVVKGTFNRVLNMFSAMMGDTRKKNISKM